jgi:hypothetical protein
MKFIFIGKNVKAADRFEYATIFNCLFISSTGLEHFLMAHLLVVNYHTFYPRWLMY